MTEAERIDFLIKVLEGDNARRFAEKTGINPTSLCKARKGTYRVRRFVERICAAYPEVNRRWLVTGEGDSGLEFGAKTPLEYEAEIARLYLLIDTLTTELRQSQAVIRKLTK